MVRRNSILIFGLVVVFLASAGTIFAHHGNSAYDEVHPITIKGTVTEFVWANPHCQIYLDVTDDKGNVTHWGIESQSPGILLRAMAGTRKHCRKAIKLPSLWLRPAMARRSGFLAVRQVRLCFPTVVY